MKAILALAVLAVIAAVTDSSAITNSARNNLNVGSITSDDILLSSRYISKPARPNVIQTDNIAYHGGPTTRIAAVQAHSVGASQFATPRIISGGVGQSNVTVNFTSARGRGYSYQLSIWGST